MGYQNLVPSFLGENILDKSQLGFPEKGTPQGGIISPLLSNVVLNELDWWIASQWEEIHTRKSYSILLNFNGSKRKGDLYRSL